MKKRELILGTIALTGSVAGMLNPQVAFAGLTCTSATGAAVVLTCTGTTAGTTYVAEAFDFTGSNGVQMGVADSTGGVALCGSHLTGKNHYGLTTEGGSMESGTGTATTTSVSGGCA